AVRTARHRGDTGKHVDGTRMGDGDVRGRAPRDHGDVRRRAGPEHLAGPVARARYDDRVVREPELGRARARGAKRRGGRNDTREAVAHARDDRTRAFTTLE